MLKKMSLCASALALLAACTSGGADEFAASTPDVRGQSVELTDSPAEGAIFQPGTGADPAAFASARLVATRTTLKGLNDLVKKFLTPVADAIAAGGKSAQSSVDVKIYGPKDENGITWELTVKRIEGRRFGWRLEGKRTGQPDGAYRTIAAGSLQRTVSAEHRGSGVTGIDLDAYASIDPTSHLQGKVFNAFKHFGDAGDAKVVVYSLKGFTTDSTSTPPSDAIVYGHKTAAGEAVVRLVVLGDSIAPAQGAPDGGRELTLVRVRSMPGAGGRADVYYPASVGLLANGDVPLGKYIVDASCWDKSEQEVFEGGVACNAGQPVSADCSSFVTVVASNRHLRDPSACEPGLQTADPMTDADQQNVSAEPDAPGTLDDVLPSSMPDPR